MGLGLLLASLGISLFDIISLKNKDINTCKQIKKILESYDYKIITTKNIRKEIWDELFKNNKKIDNIEHDDINFFYKLSMLPGTNLLSLYHNIIKEKSEIRDTYKICIDACLNDYVINKLIEDKYIIKDDYLEIKDEKKLGLRKKDKDEKNFNKELKRK